MIKLKTIITRLRARAHSGDRFTQLAPLCESPIEALFWKVAYPELSRLGDFTPQVEVGPYRLDIAIVGRGFKIAVECDGYEFHSSEAQISADNSRDLELACDGWIVIRFTGGRIWRDVRGCVRDVVLLVRAVRS